MSDRNDSNSPPPSQFPTQALQPQAPPFSHSQPGYGQPGPGYPAAEFPGGPIAYGPNFVNPGATGPRKPVSIVIFGILHLLMAFFSLAWLSWLTLMLVMAANRMNAGGFTRDPMVLIYEQMGYFQYQVFIIVLGGLLTFVLIAAGILLLMGKEKGRDLSVSYSIGSILLNLLSIAFQIIIGVVLLNGFDAPHSVSQPAGVMVLIGGGLLLFCLIYPTITLICMTRKSVKEYLKPS